jgi:hypothetical protein
VGFGRLARERAARGSVWAGLAGSGRLRWGLDFLGEGREAARGGDGVRRSCRGRDARAPARARTHAGAGREREKRGGGRRLLCW